MTTTNTHVARVILLMACAAAWLGWLSSRTDIFFADGIRYIGQAQRIDSGSLVEAIKGSVDHPAYPLMIVGAHRWIGGSTPMDWQRAGQLASITAGVLVIIPLYLIALELFGATAAWLTCLLAFLVPTTGHVFADTLSESTFLLFWSFGLWTALRFLRDGWFGWLPPTIVFAGLAYLARPEGLLLPGALVATLGLMPLLHSTRLVWPRWWAAVGLIVIGPMVIVAPYVIMRGGLSTKPAVARLLGTDKASPALAVERERPLDPNQSVAITSLLAGRAVLQALRGAVTLPILIFAPIGLIAAWRLGDVGRPRQWLFLGVIVSAGILGLMRLHATGGYCSPRHAMVVGELLLAVGAFGLARLMARVSIPGRWIGQEDGAFTAGPVVWLGIFVGLATLQMPTLIEPLNKGFSGYRKAAEFLVEHQATPDRPVIDVTGWSHYYSGLKGYTFKDLTEGTTDPRVRWVIVRDAHLNGPWGYCHQLKDLVRGREPVAKYPDTPAKGIAQVYVYDLEAQVASVSDQIQR